MHSNKMMSIENKTLIPDMKRSYRSTSVPWNSRYQPEEIINQRPPDEIVCVGFTPSTPQF
jgi:hypothetical protein